MNHQKRKEKDGVYVEGKISRDICLYVLSYLNVGNLNSKHCYVFHAILCDVASTCKL